ncbi:hypothetical protein Tco_1080981 [Tanacetum coccineum]|uniref:Histone deacetylase 14 n=1 Tax=Tanacetum coccineum TaxID=301880 RepID=A0ABQ5HWA7_9ASTR
MSPTNDMFRTMMALTTTQSVPYGKDFRYLKDPKSPSVQRPLGLIDNPSSHCNLKFNAKGTKREVFGMTIPNELINDVIRGANYYDVYLKKVAKHQQYLAGEEVSDPDSPAPKPVKQTKPKPTKQSKPTEPKAASKEPKPVPAKPQEKKRKPVLESSEAPPLAKRDPACYTQREDTEEAILQRETDTGKFQPLPEVPGKGKEKVGEEQAAQVLTTFRLQEKEARLDTESDEEMPSVVRSGAQNEGQAGPDLGKLDEDQDGPNPDDVAKSQPLPTPSVLAGPNLEHSEVEIIDPSSQPQPEHMDEGFTAAAYPDVQENLKLTVDEQEIDRKINESVKEVVISSVKHAIRAPLRARFKDLPTIVLRKFFAPTHIRDQEKLRMKSKSRFPKTPPGSPPSPPPPPLLPSGASGAFGTTGASDSAQAPPPPPPSSYTH